MEPFVIREKELIKTLFIEILIAVLVFTVLFVVIPSGLDNLIRNAFSILLIYDFTVFRVLFDTA